jgi:hypothetical protein
MKVINISRVGKYADKYFTIGKWYDIQEDKTIILSGRKMYWIRNNNGRTTYKCSNDFLTEKEYEYRKQEILSEDRHFKLQELLK